MIKGGKFGGSTKTGIEFEEKIDLAKSIATIQGYSTQKIENLCGSGRSQAYNVYANGKNVAQIYNQHSFYNFLEKQHHFDWKKVLSKRMLPDNSIYVPSNNTYYVIEVKNQNCGGSVDEKLQTCDYKKKQYEKILSPLNYNVKYFYLLNDWFKDKQYGDVLAYIKSVDCDYFFGSIPLKALGLPVFNKTK